MNETQEKIWNVFCSLSGEEVAQILTDIHGVQILDYDVEQELINLGHLEETFLDD